MTHEAAMAEIQHCAGTMFDPEVVEAFDILMNGLLTDQMF